MSPNISKLSIAGNVRVNFANVNVADKFVASKFVFVFFEANDIISLMSVYILFSFAATQC